MKIKSAFIGAGYIGKVQIPQLLRLTPKVSVEAIVESNAGLGKQIAEEFGIRKLYTDYHDVINDPKIQVINEIFIESPLLQTKTTRRYALLPSGHPMGYHDAEFNLFSEFYNAVGMNISKNKGGANYPTSEEAANELIIVEAAIKSSKEKRWVDIGGSPR